ncbi:uncharacterized protein SOCEGT47_043150 [Sorangium cellulosum]|jgi:anthranilate phosphoribosyltransferase|uniref:Glycosyl transferase family 3 domain-containing protein n=1 Tax=Sorangium cellulosum TaxID=56 RepID=A0A4P2Q387_SORCE|nr:hypothetical protein [Sorangium cellulosum]AUX23785.1 uncharacterized protein SOCEGT47_043150 [Sorangium cellulosum]
MQEYLEKDHGNESRVMLLPRERLRLLYEDVSDAERAEVLAELGPLTAVFSRFLQAERAVEPLDGRALAALFDACGDPGRSPEELLGILRMLAPAGGRVGQRQVNWLVDRLRARVAAHLEREIGSFELLPHDHAFGSGGDFCKTAHATTAASIVAAPLRPICKTGTNNVTSEHGSAQAATQMGYRSSRFDPRRINEELGAGGFAFVPLASLGFPYSDALRQARRLLWEEAHAALRRAHRAGTAGWASVVRRTRIPLDILKIVSPNAQVLGPRRHATGVCHLDMLPFVLGIFLHLGASGIIAHAYDGIDEISNASSDRSGAPNNLVVELGPERVEVAELGPEHLGLARVGLAAIREERRLADEVATLRRIVAGDERGPKRDFVVANAGALLAMGEPPAGGAPDLLGRLREGIRLAQRTIDSGAALSSLTRWAAA